MSRSAPRVMALILVPVVALCAMAAVAGPWHHHFKHPGAESLPLSDFFFKAWVRWDGDWYKGIAERGYAYTPGQQSAVAFFPLYPLAIRAVMALGASARASGILITLLCGPLAVVLFTAWARTRVDERTALQAGLLLALYPFSFYLYGVMYSDALFILLVVSAFLLLEKGHLVPAVLLGALSTAARPVAPGVVVGLLVRRLEWKRSRGERWTLWDLLPVFSALGFACYLLYLGQKFGAPFAFVETQGSPGWDQAPGWDTWLKVHWFHDVFLDGNNAEVVLRYSSHAVLTLIGLALVWPTRRLLGWGYGLFVLAIVGLPAVGTKDFMGMGRYLIAAFPLFLTLALLLRERPRLRLAILAVSGVTLVLLSWSFGRGIYVS